MNPSTNIERGALPKLVALTKTRGLNKGKGFSYAYVKQVLNPNDKRTNEAIISLAQELVSAGNKAMAGVDPTASPAPPPRMLNVPTTSDLTKDPRWKHGDRMRLMILAKERGMGGSYVEQAILGRRVNSEAAKKHFAAFREMAEEYFAARAAGKPLPVLSPTEELHALRKENAKLKEQNAQYVQGVELVADESPLASRNAALEENALYVEAELRKREEQLVELGKELDEKEKNIGILVREGQRLRSVFEENRQTIEQLTKDHAQQQTVNQDIAERLYETEQKAQELEYRHARLRAALLEQAQVHAATLKALLPQA